MPSLISRQSTTAQQYSDRGSHSARTHHCLQHSALTASRALCALQVQRFLAYAQQEHEMEPSLTIFGSARCADVAQKWLEQMLERGLMWSTLANYTNSLCNIAAHWWDSGGAIEEAALQLDPQPPDALLRLRAQAEGQSKQQQLYAKKPANWLDVRKMHPLSPAASADYPREM